MSKSVLQRVSQETRSPAVTAVSIVIPCFNEAGTIAALSEQLVAVQRKFESTFESEFVFIDDGSSDTTLEELREHFGAKDNCQIIKHAANRGIAAAIMTGMIAANNEIVISMDSDCTYDPQTIDTLVERLEGNVSLVTASPYHPDGHVVGVPKWRLLLSRGASMLYRKAIGVKLYTYTSCFRAYRRRDFIGLELKENGFVGIAEMLWLATRNGGQIVEVPATLRTRRLGYSKLRTLPVIRTHLKLLGRILTTPPAKKKTLV